MTVIVDTSIFFAFYSIKDKYHLDSLAIVAHALEGKWGRILITNHILDEVLTLLKYRISPRTAEIFIKVFIKNHLIEVMYTDERLEKQALNVFRQFIYKKGLSYTDTITVVMMREYNIGYLLSFDIRSFSGIIENLIGPNYWQVLSEEEQQKVLRLARKFQAY